MLKGLSRLYSSLVWESTVLLALCNEDILPADSEFGLVDMEKLGQKCAKNNETAETDGKKDDVTLPTSEKLDTDTDKTVSSLARSHNETGSNGVSLAMQSLSTQDSKPTSPMDVEPSTSGTVAAAGNDAKNKKYRSVIQLQAAQIKPLLTASSRLGRSLVELFGLLVKLCVGSPVRQRRSQMTTILTAPTQQARVIAEALTDLLTTGFRWTPPPTSPVPKLQ